jgi:hypothetical protein
MHILCVGPANIIVPLFSNRFIARLMSLLHVGFPMADIVYLGIAVVSFAVVAVSVMLCERL